MLHVEAQKPAVAVVDASMPALSGTAVIRRLVRSTPQCAVILYTAHDDPALLTEALDAGARGQPAAQRRQARPEAGSAGQGSGG